MESFGVPVDDIARWAGISSSVFSIAQAITGMMWGAASDKYGRKPMILFGLINTLWTMLLWGFSTSLPMALVARILEGAGNGNVGILRTTVAELCPWKELQPRAFSVMPLVWTVGAMIGPTLGGALSNPYQVDPHKARGDRLFERFPYALPNIAASAFFAIGITVGWLFLHETLESKKHEQDLGLRTGAKIVAFVRKTLGMANDGKHHVNEREPLLSQRKVLQDETEQPTSKVVEEAPKMKDVLNFQTSLNLVVYALLALYTLAYDQVCILLARYERSLTPTSYSQSSCTTLHSRSTTQT